MAFEHIEYRPGKVARLIMNRPRYLNAQGYQMLDEIHQALNQAAVDPECGAIVLSGAGRSFSAGHDLGTPEDTQYRQEHGCAGPENLYRAFEEMRDFYVDKTLAWRNCIKPTVAMVHGYCIYGGWMLAAAMDVVFASEEARFLPGLVEYFSMPWDLGPRKAKEILLEHRFLTAAEALEYGFVNRIFPMEDLESETLAYAHRVADNYLSDPMWVRMIKMSINQMQDGMGFSNSMETAFNNYCLMFGLQFEGLTQPDQGGFAKTDTARRNFQAAKPWLIKRGLASEDD